jgi:hypothetical protein
MADVEKININSTNYDIADAKALRNKSTTATGSFVDERAGNGTWPTGGSNLTYSIVIGNGAYVASSSTSNSITILGNGAYVTGSNSTAIGASAITSSYATAVGERASASASYAVAVGNNSIANYTHNVAIGQNAKANGGSYSLATGGNSSATAAGTTAVGASTSASKTGATALGNDAKAYAQFSVAVGSSAETGVNTTGAIAIGRLAGTSSSASNAIAIGNAAKVIQQNSIQIGQGTNQTYGSTQIRDWQLLNNNGKIPEERLPDGIKTATPQFPNLYDINEEKVSEQAILYTGVTNDSYKNSQFYRGRVRYGYPHFACGYVDTEWIDSQNDVTIDQQKLFTKLAEVTKQRIDDDDVENGLIGGDNAEQSIYLYYDADNDYYFLRFDSDSFEKAFNGTPDDITGLSFDDLADYGIYFRNFHKPSDLEGEYEFCDIYYYAPVYIDSYDWHDSPSYINYFKFLEGINDSDWGVGVVISGYDTWDFVVDGTSYTCPVIPKAYEYNGDEYDGIEFRWEWNGTDWTQYINGEDIDRSWSTEDLYDTFGIYVEPGEEENVEYINLYVRGGDQRYWEQFDPVDASHFCTAAEKTSIQNDITRLQNTSFQLIESATDLDTIKTSGAYWINVSGCTNLPSTASGSKSMFLFVTATDDNTVKQVLLADRIAKNYGSTNYGTYASNMYVRSLSGGTWRSWEVILTPTDLMFLQGFDKTKKQVIGHTANTNNAAWQEASGGGSYTAGDGIDITNDVISVDDLDCGTM